MPDNAGSNILSNLITIGAVALGWFLGETTGWLKSKKKTNSLKKALFEEIQDNLGASGKSVAKRIPLTGCYHHMIKSGCAA